MLALSRKTQESVVVWERIRGNDSRGSPKCPAKPDAESNGNPLLQASGPSLQTESSKEAGTNSRKLGILVVDDEPSVLVVVSKALRKQGFTVWQAANGEEALTVYRRHGVGIGVVLLDVHMPGLDGPQTMAALHAIRAEVPCCFMSGDLESGDEERLHRLGGTAVFCKPFHPAEVAHMLWDVASLGQWKTCNCDLAMNFPAWHKREPS